MAKTKQNLNLKIQMLAGKGTKEFFERFYKNLTSLEWVYDADCRVKFFGIGKTHRICPTV